MKLCVNCGGVRMMRVEKKEFELRIEKFQSKLQEEKLDGAIFFHTEELFYFTGTGVNGTLIIPSQGTPILLVRINYERGKADGFLSDVRPSDGMSTLIEAVKELYGEKNIELGISFDVTNVHFFKNLERNFPQVTFKDVQQIVWSLRLVKSEWEISQIRKAAEISYKGFEHGRKALYEGMTEVQFLKAIEMITTSFGDEGNMIQRGSNNRLPFGVVAFGENTSVISGNWMTMTSSGRSPSRPYGASERKLSEGDLVIIDKGTVYQGYHADEARTFVYGKANEKQKELHKILNDILDRTLESIYPGQRIADLYFKAEKIAESYGYKDEFMGLGQYNFKYLGHGVGLEIDEPPLISAYNKTETVPGMILAIEPKIIIPNQFGLTLEETILITNSGMEVLTSYPRERFEI